VTRFSILLILTDSQNTSANRTGKCGLVKNW